jgi:thiamine biosynthesis lipoprotein
MYRIPPPLNHLPLRIDRHKPGTSFILLLLLAGIGLAMSACSKASNNEHRHTILAFGTLIEITLFDTTEAKANAAFDQLERNFHAYHASWTPWETSDLSRINDAIRAGTEVVVPASILPMITASKALFEQSKGLFNPAIGNLINLWQMHLHEDPDIRPPDAQEIARVLRQNPSMSDIQIDAGVLHSSNPDVQLSLGAFAKGYAIDLALDYLRSQGIENAVINAGGDLRVAGKHGERPWRIGIRHPRADSVIAWLDAKAGESIFTSGDYERYYLYEGKRYHHILDPRTGYPAAGTSSVTVIHDDAGTADAAATALFVAGPEHWHEVARSMGIRFVMLIDTDGGIHMNPAMHERINLVNPESGHIVLSQPL